MKSYDAGDQQRVAEQRNAVKLRTKQEDGDLRTLSALVPFRRFLMRVFDHCHLLEVSFTGDSKTFFREGERSVALWLYGEWQRVSPEDLASALITRIQEAKAARTQAEALSEKENSNA